MILFLAADSVHELFWLNLIGRTFQHNRMIFYRLSAPKESFCPVGAEIELGAVNPEETTRFSWGLKGSKNSGESALFHGKISPHRQCKVAHYL